MITHPSTLQGTFKRTEAAEHMKIWITLACALLATCVCVAVTLLHNPSSGRTYTVADLAAGLQRRPSAWLGRPLIVHARAIATCASCRHEQDLLVDPHLTHPPDPYTSIPIVIKSSDLAVFVQRLPLIGAALAPPPRLPLTGIFRVLIERDLKAGAATPCALWCYDVVWVSPL